MSTTHYFQRYSQKENVATNNTLLFLSRLNQYSPSKFSAFLSDLLEIQDIKTGVQFSQQTKGEDSVPDGGIEQESFKILIETKLFHKNFTLEQLVNHLTCFKSEYLQVLLALSPRIPDKDLEKSVQSEIKIFNQKNNKNVVFISTTFKNIIALVESKLDNYEFEFLEIVKDFEAYCRQDKLLPDNDALMRVVTCGKSLQENFDYNCYYDPAERKYSDHDYIGIYSDKKIQGVGKIVNIIVAGQEGEEIKIIENTAEVTAEHKAAIKALIQEAWKNNGWDISKKHRYFFVDNFYKTNFVKETKFPLQGTKFFNLLDLLGLKKLPSTEEIAKLLSEKTW